MSSRCSFVAVSLIVFQGCTSYYVLTEEEVNKKGISSETAIRVTRNDSSVVESGPFRHLLVQEPSDLIIGSGSERKSGKPFTGKVPRLEIDSARQIQVEKTDGVQQTFFVLWLNNKTSLAFSEYDYLNITPEHQTGLWCAGTVTDGNHVQPFKGRIDSLSIRKIEAEGISLFHPSLPSSGDASEQEFQWANLGLGVAGGLGASFLANYSLLSKTTFYSARFTSIFTLLFPGASGGSERQMVEFAALYGLGFKSRFLAASVSGGISYVSGSEQVSLQSTPGYKTIEFSTVSFPLDLELAITPLQSFGIALKIFSTSNSKKSWGGGALCLQFGL